LLTLSAPPPFYFHDSSQGNQEILAVRGFKRGFDCLDLLRSFAHIGPLLALIGRTYLVILNIQQRAFERYVDPLGFQLPSHEICQ
jgi:hypothetical protein